MAEPEIVPGSFRDPSGFVFRRGGQCLLADQPALCTYLRSAEADWSVSGFDRSGTNSVAQREVDLSLAATPDAYAVVQPRAHSLCQLPLRMASQFKQAALLTLTIEEQALKDDLSLKDSSAYNIQFVGARPVMIDTSSFESYVEGQPWVAYRQFCQHFLAPLALMSKADVRLQQLLRVHLDGLPLDLTSALLPVSSRLNVGLLTDFHLHAGARTPSTRYGPAGPRVGRIFPGPDR